MFSFLKQGVTSLVFLLAFFTTPNFVFADEVAPTEAASAQVVSTTSPVDIVSVMGIASDSAISFSTTLKNTTASTIGVRVGADFYPVADDFVVAGKSVYSVGMGEVISLDPMSERAITVTTPLPTLPTSQYRVVFGVTEDRSVKTYVSKQALVVDIRSDVVLNLRECRLGDVSLDQFVVKGSAGEMKESTLTCRAKVAGTELLSGTALVRLSDRKYDSGHLIGTINFQVQDGDMLTIPVTVPDTPGAYDFSVVTDRGPSVATRLVLSGRGGTIETISELSGPLKSGEKFPFQATVRRFSDEPVEVRASLISDEQPCAEQLALPVKGNDVMGDMPITADCSEPTMMVTLVTPHGAVLDTVTRTASLASAERNNGEEVTKNTSVKGLVSWDINWGIVLVVILFGALIIGLAYRRVRLAGPLLFVLVAVSIFGSQVPRAQAVSWAFWSESCPICGSAGVRLEINPMKTTFSPGEEIKLEIIVTPEDFASGLLDPLVTLTNNATSQSSSDLFPGIYPMANYHLVDVSTGVLAPNVSGSFSIRINGGINGYSYGSGGNPPAFTQSGLSVTGAQPPTTCTWGGGLLPWGAGCSAFVSATTRNVGQSYGPHTNTAAGYTGSVTFDCTSSPVNGGWTVASQSCSPVAATPSATFISAPPCSIPDGQGGCNTAISWTASNTSQTTLTNCNNDYLHQGFGSGPFTAPTVYVPYNLGCYRIHDGGPTGPVLAQTTISSFCASQPWSGTTCGSPDALCGTGDGATYPTAYTLADLGLSAICQRGVGNIGTADGHTSTDTISADKQTISYGSLDRYMIGMHWRCDSQFGGRNQYCFIYKYPSCGFANGGTFSSPPTDPTNTTKQQLCMMGIPTAVTTNATTYTWQCNNTGAAPVSCSANRTGSAPTATITATGPVAMEDQSLWERVVGWVTGRDHVALANHQNATITAGQNAMITWSSTNTSAGDCTVSGGSGAFTYSNTSTGGSNTFNSMTQGTYTYTISCFNAGGSASHSATVTVNPSGGGAPGCPGCGGGGDFITATPGACGTGTINVDWNDEAGATWYEIERDGGSALSTGGTSSYSHTGLTAGSNHSYRARACNGNGCSTWSNFASANAPGSCVASNYTITASAVGGGSISPSGSWSVSAGSSQSFTVTPSGGHTISSVTVNGFNQGAVSNLTLSNINQDYTVIASFTPMVGSSCPAGVSKSWSVNGNSCDGLTNLTSDGQIGGVTDGAGLTTGAANYRCTNGSWAANPEAGAVCTVVVGGSFDLGSRFGTPPSIASGSLVQGQTVAFNSTTYNWGSQVSSEYNNVFLYCWGAGCGANTPFSTHAYTAIAAGANRPDVSESLSLTQSGTLRVRVCTGGTVGEPNTGNNCDQLPDLTVNPPVSNYTITASVTGGSGSISPSGSVSVSSGGSQAFTMTPSSGYAIQSVLVDGISIGNPSSYTFNNVTSNRSISVSFVAQPSGPWATIDLGTCTIPTGQSSCLAPIGWASGNLTAAPGIYKNIGGTCTPSTIFNCQRIGENVGNLSINAGATAPLTYGSNEILFIHRDIVNPAILATVTRNMTCSGSDTWNGTICQATGPSCTGPPAPASQVVIANGTAGSVWGSGPFTTDSSLSAIARFLGAPQGGSATLSISDIGCVSSFTGSTANGVTTTSYGSWRGMNVTCTSGCSGGPATYTIIASVTGGSGSISPSGSVSVSNGGSQAFTMTPSSGYAIQSVLVDGISIGNPSSYTFNNVTSNRSISVSFVVTASCPGGPAPASQAVIADGSAGSVWGSGPFTTDSNLSKIARFLGVPDGQGVQLNISDIGCVSSFTGSTANGVTTTSYGSWRGMNVALGPLVDMGVAIESITPSSCVLTSNISEPMCRSGLSSGTFLAVQINGRNMAGQACDLSFRGVGINGENIGQNFTIRGAVDCRDGSHTVFIPITWGGLGVSTSTWYYVGRGAPAAWTVSAHPLGGNVVLDDAMYNVQCDTGFVWNEPNRRCEAINPTVDLKINGSDGPLTLSPGNMTLSWTTGNGATSCSAQGPGWTGPKPTSSAGETISAVTGTYTLTCTNGIPSGSDSVDVTLSCTPSCTAWSACGPPCSGGDGTQSRTCTTATCITTPQTQSCTTDVCRDLNWKEIGQ